MKTSAKGLEIIKRHEGFRSEPYLCPAGVPTIGYGATYYPSGRKVTLNDPPITEEDGLEMLKKMLIRFEKGVERYVQTYISQNMFDALVSFSYNVGLEAFRQSTLLKRINVDPCNPDIDYQFSRWNKAGGRKLRGLAKRRQEESELYFS